MIKSFKGGIHPLANKQYSKDSPIENGFRPSTVVIPMSQHIGAPCEPLVKKGDHVSVGDKIGQSNQFVSAPIHASISGIVTSVANMPHPVSGMVCSVIIDADKDLENTVKYTEKTDEQVRQLNIDELKENVKENGIVGLGGAAFPSFIKISPPKDKKIDTLIFNGAECEPYLTADYRLMLENSLEIIKGIKIIAKILEVKSIFIGIETNKPDAILKLSQTLKENNIDNIKVVPLKEKYPQGGEKQLIYAITKRKVPSRRLPMDIGVCVHNVGTAFAIYEAVYKEKPLIERVVTITGNAVLEPKNVLVPIGSLYKDIIEYCGGLTAEPEKIIMGGPMMGFAQYSLDIPVIKGTSGIIINKKDESCADKDYPCINCGRCVDACAMNLQPSKLCGLIEKEKYIALEEYKIHDCMECGACAYICPAKKPIVQLIRKGKII